MWADKEGSDSGSPLSGTLLRRTTEWYAPRVRDQAAAPSSLSNCPSMPTTNHEDTLSRAGALHVWCRPPRWGAHASLRGRVTSMEAPDFLRVCEWHRGCETTRR